MFTGPKREIPKAALKMIFRIRKDLVLDFLCLLQANNKLYSSVVIEPAVLDLYDDEIHLH
jgi:hypothetical protein